MTGFQALEIWRDTIVPRKEGRKEGRIEGRMDGRMDGRKEGRKEGLILPSRPSMSVDMQL